MLLKLQVKVVFVITSLTYDAAVKYNIDIVVNKYENSGQQYGEGLREVPFSVTFENKSLTGVHETQQTDSNKTYKQRY